MNKKIIYLISVITFLLILTISYFIPLSLSGLVNNSNQVSMVWNDIGVRNGMTYMDCTEYAAPYNDVRIMWKFLPVNRQIRAFLLGKFGKVDFFRKK